MMDKKYYREYIQDSIINHLERLMGSQVEVVSLYNKYFLREGYPPKDATYKGLLHEMMLPYYNMYLNGDTRLCCAGGKLEFIGRKMAEVIADDDQFGHWASEQDLIAAAECWGDNMRQFEKEDKRIYRFFHVLDALFESDCQQDWEDISEKLKEMLFKGSVCYNYKTDEVLCVLYSYTMIMQQDWPPEKKKEQLGLLNNHWKFLKHYFTVMTCNIIGVKWTSFKKVAETVMTASQSFKPHMHIFYCGLLDCVDKLNLDRKHRRELDKVIVQMQGELNRIKSHSEVLYELCDALFPEDFQRLLNEHRPPSYKEVEDESKRKDELNRQLQEQNKRLSGELKKVEQTLQQMILSAIPINDIDAELEQYPPGMAWDMLQRLQDNPVIHIQPAWRDHYPELLRKYRSKLFAPIDQQKELADAVMKVAERPTYNYEAGSTHNDKRQQLVMGEERDKAVQIRRLANE